MDRTAKIIAHHKKLSLWRSYVALKSYVTQDEDRMFTEKLFLRQESGCHKAISGDTEQLTQV